MKTKTLLIFLLITLFSVIFATQVFAAGENEPQYVTIDGQEIFIANGTPIVISEIGDEVPGAKITWEGGSQIVSELCTVVGGRHNDTTLTPTESSITMNGGTVKYIAGGGLHYSNTTSAKIVLKGGTVHQVNGGALDGWVSNCPCGNNSGINPEEVAANCKVGTAEVVVDGATVTSVIYGGGCQYAHTDKTIVTIKSGDCSGALVTPGGSNGTTKEANLIIEGGKVRAAQTGMRGTIETANMQITGGEVTKLYVGEFATGVQITKPVTVEVSGTAKVATMSISDEQDEPSNIKVVPGTIANIDSLVDKTTTLFVVKIDGTEYLLESGKTLKDLEEYAKITTKEGYEFKGFKKGTEAFAETTAITSDIELTTVFEEIEAPVVEGEPAEGEPVEGEPVEGEPKEEEKDNTPKTGSINVPVYVWFAVATIALVGIVTTKKPSKHSK